jgi:exosortase
MFLTLSVGLVAAVAATVLYGPVVAGLIRQWYADPVSSHGVLLVAAAAVVTWQRRARLAAAVPRPRNWGFGLLALALAGYLAGSLAGDIFAQRVSLPLALAGTIVALAGPMHARVLLPSIALLLLAVPLPSSVVTALTLPLQLVASQVAAVLLGAATIDVVRQGNLLILREITLEVADACSGLRSLVSLVSVAAMVGALLSLGIQRTAFLMLAAAPIAVIGNGLRVAATGFLTTWIGEAAVRGALHDVTGYVAFAAMCAAIVLLQRATRGVRAPIAQVAGHA